MMDWIHSHAESLALTFKHIFAQPAATLLSIVVIGIGLLFPLCGYLVLTNLKALAAGVSTDPHLNIFLTKDVDQASRAALEQRLRTEPLIIRFRFVSKDAALNDLIARTGNPDMLAGLSSNPLPDAFLAVAADRSEASQTRLADTIRGWPGVETVDVDDAWSRRLRTLIRTSEYVVLGIGVALALAMLAICFNTIRLQVLTRTEEIAVLRLFGATSAQIRRPFLYFGAFQGFAAGLLAWGTAIAAVEGIEPMLAEVIRDYVGAGRLSGLSFSDGLSLLGFSTSIGVLGAWLAGRED